METLDQTRPSPSGAVRPLVAEVISIGDEMTSGARIDTNGAWLRQRLGDLGCEVQFHSTVGDDLTNKLAVFQIAIERADVVVCTGGLGPTQDDLTRAVLAQLAGVELELDPESLKHIEGMFAKRGREMPERNQTQAMFPVGSRVIFNPQGTAPGVDIEIQSQGGKSRVFAFPGVPAEMKQMFDASTAPVIAEMTGGGGVIRNHVMKFFGTGESDMESRLGDMIARGRNPRVGITVSSATISLRITATAETNDQCEAMIESTRQEAIAKAGEFFFGDGESYEQHHAIIDTLQTAGQTLGIVEIGHAGRLADWMAAVEGPSVYQGSVHLRGRDQLTDRFAMNDTATDANAIDANATDDTNGSESDHTHWRAAAQWMGVDWLIGVDSYPTLSCTDDAPLPAANVRLIVVGPDQRVSSTQVSMAGHPSILQARIAKAAMSWMRQVMKTP